MAYDTFCRLRQLHDQQGLKTAQSDSDIAKASVPSSNRLGRNIIDI